MRPGWQKPIRGSQLNRAHPLSDGLIGCWLFNEGVGNILNDISGKRQYGTNSGASWEAGKTGTCLNFDGSSQVTGNLSFSGNIFSISVLFNTRDNSYSDVLIFGAEGSHRIEVQFGGPGDLRLIAYETATRTAALADIVATNTWYHAVGVSDGSLLNLYVDGIFVASATGDQSPTISAFSFGTASAVAQLPGKIDHVMFWDRALNASEVHQLYSEPFMMISRKSYAKYSIFGAISLSIENAVFKQHASIPNIFLYKTIELIGAVFGIKTEKATISLNRILQTISAIFSNYSGKPSIIISSMLFLKNVVYGSATEKPSIVLKAWLPIKSAIFEMSSQTVDLSLKLFLLAKSVKIGIISQPISIIVKVLLQMKSSIFKAFSQTTNFALKLILFAKSAKFAAIAKIFSIAVVRVFVWLGIQKFKTKAESNHFITESVSYFFITKSENIDYIFTTKSGDAG